MIRLPLAILNWLCLATALAVLWNSKVFPERLPDSWDGWVKAFFGAFKDDFTGPFILALTMIVALYAWFADSLLFQLALQIFSLLLGMAVMIGILNLAFPAIRGFFLGLG